MIPLMLTLSGFMSYHEEQTLNFEDDSLWVLVGKNASGKSSIFDAIIFVLFGETRVKEIPNSELVNHNSNSAHIIFDFAVGNMKYRVSRTIDKKGSTTRQAYILFSKPDGSLSPQLIPLTHKEKEFKNWIENDIGLNYEVFITSVLLRQGKADAFLEASTDTRYEVLSKLIDLAKYSALEAKARENKKSWEAQASFHRDNLSRMTPITDQDLNEAQIMIDQEDKTVEASRRMAGTLRILFGQASQWEHLNSDLLDTDRKIQAHQTLLNRSDEINARFQRLVDLRGILPNLKAICDLAQAIRIEDAEVIRLSQEWRDDDELIRDAEQSFDELDADHKRKARQAQGITSESTQLYRRLNELSSVMGLIDQIEKLGEKLEQYRVAISEYPESLDVLLKDSETKRDEALEAQQALPGLTRLASERTKLAEAEQLRLRLFRQLSEKKLARPKMVQAKEDAQAAFIGAEADKKKMRDAQTETHAHLTTARQQLENFNRVAGAAKCQYCGSDLTDAHKAKERQRLMDNLEEREQLAASADEAHNLAVETFDLAERQHRTAVDNLVILDTEIGSNTQHLETCEHDIRERLSAIDMTFNALPEAYQARICLSKPTNAEAWAETVYPQSNDQESIKAIISQISARSAEATRLSTQVANRNRVQTLSTSTGETLAATRKNLPANWETLRAEYQNLKIREEGLASRFEVAQRDAQAASDALEIAKKDLQTIRDRQSRRSGVLETSRTGLLRKRESLSIQIAQMPEGWQSEAETMTEGQLGSLVQEMKMLQVYDDLHQQLTVAGQTLWDLRLHEAEVQGKINDLPAEARRPATQIDQELSDALDASRKAEERLSQARTRQSQLLTQGKQYKESDSCLKAAARKAYLYGILCDQFGEKGIQKAIINKAEIAIVRISNQMLDNLSGGRSKLRLREAGGNKKALNLEVWDSCTGGDKPILASLASGSQRFRIAISLALGIGQYIGNESNRIESVIIDEGFGSLDREGRESIIQELYNLSRHLKRIILVSHQEEFSRGFSTGYEILLVDGASQIRPLVQ